jgi:hypothetical protein
MKKSITKTITKRKYSIFCIEVIPIRRFTDKELIILAALADDKGHALWDLEQKTEIRKSNLKPKIDSLIGKGAIYKGAARKTRNKNSSHPNDTEHPYYIRPQMFFFAREELRRSLRDTQSKLIFKRDKKRQSSTDEVIINKLRNKLDLYRKLLADFETCLKTLRIVSPRDRIKGNYDVEIPSNEPEFEPGAFIHWSPFQTEIYKIAKEIEEYCTSPEASVCAALEARPDLYAAHDKWIRDNPPRPLEDLP